MTHYKIIKKKNPLKVSMKNEIFQSQKIPIPGIMFEISQIEAKDKVKWKFRISEMDSPPGNPNLTWEDRQEFPLNVENVGGFFSSWQ